MSTGSTVDFQRFAKAGIEATLRDAGISYRSSEEPARRGVTLVVQFPLNGLEHEINISEDNAVMVVDDSLFECYLSSEWSDPETLAAAFAKRLHRYLSGGTWKGADEAGPLWRGLRRFFTAARRALGRGHGGTRPGS